MTYMKNVRNHILSLEALQPNSKAYSLVYQLEKEKPMSNILRNSDEASAYNMRMQQQNIVVDRKDKTINQSYKLSYLQCKRSRYKIENCFGLIGYPKWYKCYKEKKITKYATQIGANEDQFDTPFYGKVATTISNKSLIEEFDFVLKICCKAIKMLKGKHHQDDNLHISSIIYVS